MAAAALILLLSLAIVEAQMTPFCSNDQTDSDKISQMYRVNLESALSALPQKIERSGFYNASMGGPPDRVNVMALCRGDIELDPCRNCLRSAITKLRSCPYQEQGMFWSGDECMVRYSDKEIFTTLATSPAEYTWSFYNKSIEGNLSDGFKVSVPFLLGKLQSKAVRGAGFQRKVAGGNTTGIGDDSRTIFGLVQCTPDLNSHDCEICLEDGARELLQPCCDSMSGGWVTKPSCFLRFQLYPFFNATTLQTLDLDESALLDLPPTGPPPPTGDQERTKIIAIAASTIAGALAVVLIVGILLRRQRKPKPINQPETKYEIISTDSLHYPFSTISTATNGFSDDNKLGKGGFGPVYKGILPDGQEIAVKRLSKDSRQGSLEFKNEVLLLAQLQHRNLVRLLGFCLEGSEKLLVYEFIPNGSLDQFIFDPNNRFYLNWNRRCNIIGGIARGLVYLHEDSRLKIIHHDLKAGNILLDNKMNPKVADFGMARLLREEETQGNTTRIAGTRGYMPPEYLQYGDFSIKSDVFSFGVVALEIISGQNNSKPIRGESALNLLSFAWKSWCNGTTIDILDPVLRLSLDSMSDVLRWTQIALLCVQKIAEDRPTMTDVVLMLSSSTLPLAVPSEPAFYMHGGPLSMQRAEGPPHEYGTRNDMSISLDELWPR